MGQRKSTPLIGIVLFIAFLVPASVPGICGLCMAGETAHVIRPGVNLRAGASMSATSLRTLDLHQELELLKNGEWCEVIAPGGVRGYVRSDLLARTQAEIHVQEKRLVFFRNGKQAESFDIDLCQDTPPTMGRHCLRFIDNKAEALPGRADLRLALQEKRITYARYLKTLPLVNQCEPTAMDAVAGGFDLVTTEDGCAKGDVIVKKQALDTLRGALPDMARLDVFDSRGDVEKSRDPAWMRRQLTDSMHRQLETPALYTSAACGFVAMPYPMGDVPLDQAVCTDVVIRALRDAGVDLQALMHEDAILHPGRYKRWIKSPNHQIDHRRTRNIRTWLEHHAQALPLDVFMSPESFQPGDVLIMDTGVGNGTPYDHIGLVADAAGPDGRPLVFNIWDINMRTRYMNLLEGTYPELVGHYRLGRAIGY